MKPLQLAVSYLVSKKFKRHTRHGLRHNNVQNRYVLKRVDSWNANTMEYYMLFKASPVEINGGDLESGRYSRSLSYYIRLVHSLYDFVHSSLCALRILLEISRNSLN